MGGRVLDFQTSDPGSGNPMFWTTNWGNSQVILGNFGNYPQISARPVLSRLTELSDLSSAANDDGDVAPHQHLSTYLQENRGPSRFRYLCIQCFAFLKVHWHNRLRRSPPPLLHRGGAAAAMAPADGSCPRLGSASHARPHALEPLIRTQAHATCR
eukprot:6213065-Pleurochrysis_carterae.AAC.3